MTAQQYTPKDAPIKKPSPKKVDKKPSASAMPQKVVPEAARLAAEKMKDRLERFSKSGARDGDKLWTPKIPGYVGRWAIDDNGRIDELENMGYFIAEVKDFPQLEAVYSNSDTTGKVSILVKDAQGNPTQQYLMLCDERFVQERRDSQEQRRQRLEEAVSQAQNGKGLGNERDSTGRSTMYDPTGGNSAFKVD